MRVVVSIVYMDSGSALRLLQGGEIA